MNLAMKLAESPSVRLAESLGATGAMQRISQQVERMNMFKGVDTVFKPNETMGNFVAPL
ncbi:MAG: hypothetical protein GXY34_12975 [Syntrophomonadaceae bacterium]|nr:hypothetical protein [Syntrophomonadaceae bacterium]